MSLSRTELSYRRMAIEGASPIGLLIALLDILVSDLRRAATALHNNDIETRCRELNHAALALGQLESWVDTRKGGEAAQVLIRFYAQIRAKMMEAAVTKSAKVLETQIARILHVRTAWQNLDVAIEPPPKPNEHLIPQMAAPRRPQHELQTERIPFSQSG